MLNIAVSSWTRAFFCLNKVKKFNGNLLHKNMYQATRKHFTYSQSIMYDLDIQIIS